MWRTVSSIRLWMPEGQPIAGRGDLVEHRVEPVGGPAHDMQDRPEHLAVEPRGAVDLEGAGREEGAVLGRRAAGRSDRSAGLRASIRCGMALQGFAAPPRR